MIHQHDSAMVRREDDASEQTFVPLFVDHLMPLLKPYETTLYLYLYRKSHETGSSSVRVGLRTVSRECGIGTRSATGGNLQHIREVLGALEAKGCISIGDRTREGTLFTVRRPDEVEAVRERLAASSSPPEPEDYYRDPVLRRALFERDSWKCGYCGDPVTEETATLDHRMPISKGGANTKQNLVTACLMCNSLKSGKTIEEAAPLILDSIRERRSAAT